MEEALHGKSRGRRFDSGPSHHPARPCREVVFFLFSFPARRMPGTWLGSSVGRAAVCTAARARVRVPPPTSSAVRWPARFSLFPAAGRNAAPGTTPPGLVIPGCPYTDPSGHGLPLVRAPSEFAAPRIHHGSVVPAEGPPNFIHLFSRKAPRKDGAAAGGIPLPWQPCHKHRVWGFGLSSNGSTPLEKWQAVCRQHSAGYQVPVTPRKDGAAGRPEFGYQRVQLCVTTVLVRHRNAPFLASSRENPAPLQQAEKAAATGGIPLPQPPSFGTVALYK